MRKFFTFKNTYYIGLIGFVFLANLALIFNNNVWCDEAFVMNACNMDTKELFDLMYNQDTRPPLYLFTAKIVTTIFGCSVPVLKFFSLIPAVLSGILGATVVDKNWGNGKLYTGTIFILLMGLAPITTTKNIEISMYSWTAFFVVASTIFAYNILQKNDKKNNWILFILCALGAAGTHYYSVLVEIFIYLFLYVCLLIKDKKNLKPCIISALMTFVGYIPILPFFFSHFGITSEHFWITKTNLGTILEALRLPFEGENRFIFTTEFTIIFWMLILGSFIYLFSITYSDLTEKKKAKQDIIFALLCLIVILCFLGSCLVLSKLIRPLFINRYMYVAIGLLWLYIAIVFGELITEKLAAPMCLGLILCFILFSYPTLLNREYNTGTDKVINYLNDTMSENDILINNIEECMNWNLNFHFPEHEAYLDVDTDEYYKNETFDFSKLNTTAWYLCDTNVDIPDYILESETLSCEVLTSEGFIDVTPDTYDNIDDIETFDIDQYYWFNIYKITSKTAPSR